jgi:5'-nucleotidase
MKAVAAAVLSLVVVACTTPGVDKAASPVTVGVIGLNDFHGNLEPPKSSIQAPAAAPGETVRVPAGGVAYLASAVARLRAANPHSVVVSAGDMIGASPIASAVFLDEPTILAMNLVGVDLNAVGNHEFDKGSAELLRMQNGGCDKNTGRQPCALEPFPGAKFRYLAANVATADGGTLFPAYSLRTFGKGRARVKIGFIGLTTKATPSLVTPSGVTGLTFRDEAETINALVPKLKAEGADAIVILIHEGLGTKVGYNDKSCGGVAGDLLDILAKLDPRVDLVVSGHTHNAYVCDYGQIDSKRPFLVTSAGRYGTLVTDIRLDVDPAAGRVVSKRADNLIVQGEAYRTGSGEVAVSSLYPVYTKDPAVAALVDRYVKAAAPLAARVVGHISGPALRAQTPSREQVLGDLVADSQLAAMKPAGAEVAFMNGFGVRADLDPGPGGAVTYGHLFAVQPFGNTLMVKSFTGRQIRAVLEQQFDSGGNTVSSPNMLLPSASLTYSYDLSKPAGQRILDLKVDGAPIVEDRAYRVAMSNFLATGGDNFTIFKEGTSPVGGPLDLDALEAYFAAGPVTPPVPDRIRDITPKP